MYKVNKLVCGPILKNLQTYRKLLHLYVYVTLTRFRFSKRKRQGKGGLISNE